MSVLVKKHKKWIFTVLMIFLSCITLVVMKNAIKTDKVVKNVYSIQPDFDTQRGMGLYQPLIKGYSVIQEFSTDSEFHGFSIAVHSENITNTGMTHVQLIEKENGNVLYDDSFENSTVSKDTLLHFYLDGNNRGKAYTEYILRVESDTEDLTESLSLYMRSSGTYNGILLENGVVNGSRSVTLGTFQYTYKIEYLFEKMIWIIIILFAALCIIYSIFHEKLHIVAFAAVISFGFIYMLLFPPGKTHDAMYHYAVIYTYSNDLLGIESIPESDYFLLQMRSEDFSYYQKNIRCMNPYHGNPSADGYLDELESFSFKCTDNTLIRSDLIESREGIVGYLPYVLGLTLARVLNMGAVPAVYVAELFALIINAFIILLAVKLAAIGKEVLLMAAVLPVTLEQFVCLSYDGITISIAFLFIGIWLRYMYYQGDKHNRTISFKGHDIAISWEARNISYMVIMLVFLAGCKGGIYVLLGALLLPIINKKLPLKVKIILISGLVTVMCLFFLPKYMTIFSGAMGENAAIIDTENSAYYYAFALRHPIQFLLMTIGTFVEKPDYYFGSIFGAYLGWNTLMIPISMIVPFVMMLFLGGMRSDKDETSLSCVNRRIIALIVIIFTLATAFLMLYMTPVGWNINGLDGRYYLPFLPLIFLAVRNQSIHVSERIKKKILVFYGYWDAVVLFYVLWYAMSR